MNPYQLSESETPAAMPENAFEGDLRSHVHALSPAWQNAFLNNPGSVQSLQRLSSFLDERLAQRAIIFPKRPLRALLEIQPQDVQVVLLGQDPYHGPNQAQGLAFSVPDSCRIPPSLRNMFAELAREYPDTFVAQRHSLVRWARRGVLLLNSALTVEVRQAGSHAKKGWEIITNSILERVLQEPRPKVLLLWGAHAQSKEALLHTQPPAGPILVLKANHPSPLSATRPPRPFIGCGHFRAANEWLRSQGEAGVDWLDNHHTPPPSGSS